LPWHANINAVVGVVLYSIAFSVLVNPSLFFSNFSNTIIELLYNIIIGFVFFIIFAKVFDYENRSLRAVMRAK
jgi:hypothetical protein